MYACLYLKHVFCKYTIMLGLVFYPFWQELLVFHFISVFLPVYIDVIYHLTVVFHWSCLYYAAFFFLSHFFLDCSIVFWLPFYLLCWLFSHIYLLYLFSSFPRDYNTHLEHTSIYLGLLLANFDFLIWLRQDLHCIMGDPSLWCTDSSGDVQAQ